MADRKPEVIIVSQVIEKAIILSIDAVRRVGFRSRARAWSERKTKCIEIEIICRREYFYYLIVGSDEEEDKLN